MIVQAFAERGADVVIASRKLDFCEIAAQEVRVSTGRTVVSFEYHAGHWPASAALADFVYERFGRCDVLVNKAGMSPRYDSLTSVTEDLFDKVVAVNLKGPFRLSTLIGHRMAASKGGSIISVSSIAAIEPTSHELTYTIAKAGIHALSKGLARSFTPQVRSNVIMPGAFLTDIARAWDQEAFATWIRRRIPLERAGLPAEIAGAALYLASPASSSTTGAVIKVDGGMAWSAG